MCLSERHFPKDAGERPQKLAPRGLPLTASNRPFLILPSVRLPCLTILIPPFSWGFTLKDWSPARLFSSIWKSFIRIPSPYFSAPIFLPPNRIGILPSEIWGRKMKYFSCGSRQKQPE
jgi:hypothetical protein